MQYLIDRLGDLERQPDALVAAIHACWLRQRRAEGWVLGRADHLGKSSPYLKPLEEFTAHELDREYRLALNDLRGTIKAVALRQATCEDSRTCNGHDTAQLLGLLHKDREFVETVCAIIHDGWRDANRLLGTYRHDARLSLPFDMLPDGSKRVTIANVCADIEAIAELLCARQA